jgi:hypothetical protein
MEITQVAVCVCGAVAEGMAAHRCSRRMGLVLWAWARERHAAWHYARGEWAEAASAAHGAGYLWAEVGAMGRMARCMALWGRADAKA